MTTHCIPDGAILSARGITKRYAMGAGDLDVLTGVDIDLMRGSVVAIVGESGAGKSTLLHILGMLDRPTNGTLYLNGDPLIKKSEAELAAYRNRFVGFIFQFHHLLPEFTALENVLMPAMINGRTFEESRDTAAGLLERVGLGSRMDHKPREMSGGEQQRVAVARAVMNAPTLILGDEPSGNLDHRNSLILHDLIWEMARENDCTFVVVTHDNELARRADMVYELSGGVLIDRTEQDSANISAL